MLLWYPHLTQPLLVFLPKYPSLILALISATLKTVWDMNPFKVNHAASKVSHFPLVRWNVNVSGSYRHLKTDIRVNFWNWQHSTSQQCLQAADFKPVVMQTPAIVFCRWTIEISNCSIGGYRNLGKEGFLGFSDELWRIVMILEPIVSPRTSVSAVFLTVAFLTHLDWSLNHKLSQIRRDL